MASLTYQPARPEQLPAIQRLANHLQVYCPDDVTELWVAQNADDVVAFISWQVVAEYADLLAIAVQPAYQRQGIARHLHKISCPKALCTLEVRASNHSAQALYCALGYQPVGVRKQYYPVSSGGREDAWLYQYDARAELSTEIVHKSSP